ncbi:MAG: condensation domain-containing protein, partial [Nannocystaceae bacterium]
MSLEYSRACHNAETIESLANEMMQSVERLIEHCLEPAAGTLTPSDFPFVQLGRSELAGLRTQLKGRRVEAIYPLISVQQELLNQTRLSPAPGMWRTQVVLNLSGPLKPKVFRRAWERVLHEHPLLRSGFVSNQVSMPVQVVVGGVDIPWTEFDWRDVGDRREALARLCNELLADAPPVDEGPLMRLALIKWSNTSFSLVLDNHHLVADGWSLGVIVRALANAYEGI